MKTALLMMLGVFVIGMLFVVLPVVADTFSRLRGRRAVTCPETRGPAEIKLDARGAAFWSAFGKRLVRVKNCTLWPRKQECQEQCLKESRPEL